MKKLQAALMALMLSASVKKGARLHNPSSMTFSREPDGSKCRTSAGGEDGFRH